MKKLSNVSIGSETKKEAKREFDFPSAIITPCVVEETKDGIVSKKVTSGSLYLDKESLKLLKLEGADDRMTISTSDDGLFIHNSTNLEIVKQFQKKVTKAGMLKLSYGNLKRIYTDNCVNIFESWYFKLDECIADLPGEDNAKVYVFTSYEKRA